MEQIWNDIISRPKWYAGVLNERGGFYTASSARKLKIRFAAGFLSESIIERVFNAHGYFLEKSWVKRSEDA